MELELEVEVEDVNCAEECVYRCDQMDFMNVEADQIISQTRMAGDWRHLSNPAHEPISNECRW